jgi:hypothetical protein
MAHSPLTGHNARNERESKMNQYMPRHGNPPATSCPCYECLVCKALESGLRALCSRVVYLAAPPGYPRAGALPLVGGAL